VPKTIQKLSLDYGGRGDSFLPVPDYVNALAYSTHEEFTVPTWAKYMLISVSVLSYINRTDNAAVPADVTDGTASFMLNPGEPIPFAVAGGEVYSLVSAGAVATIGFYG